MDKVKQPPFLRSGTNYDMELASEETGLMCPEEEGRTQQQFREEADINTIVRRFGLTGELPQNPRPPMTGDFSNITDFKSAMDAVHKAQDAFMEFPPELRARFKNDPQQMLAFVADGANREEAIKLGMIKKPVEVPRAEPAAGSPPPAAAA